MKEYYKTYMQKEQAGASVKEDIGDFGMYCMELPFTVAGQAKELTSRDWAEEDGKDVYVPAVLKMQTYTLKAKFGCKGDKFSANASIRAFVDYLTGRDGSGVYLKIYNEYTKIGRRHVRFSKLSDDATLVRSDEDGDILVIQIEFQVDDPVTDVAPVTDIKGKVTKLD